MKEREQNEQFFEDCCEGRLRCLYKAPSQGYRGAAAESLMWKRSYLDGKFWEKSLFKLCKSCHVKTRIIFSSAKCNEDYIAPK